MNLPLRLTTIFILGISLEVTAQQSEIYTFDDREFMEALELYNNEQYQASQLLFEKVKANTTDVDTEADAAYYIANAAIRTNQLGADKLMEDFFAHYPTSTKRNNAYLQVADYYFNQGKYAYALRWYDKAEKNSMTVAERETFNFKKGYSLFVSKNYKAARTYFDRVSVSEKYGSQAKYYIGYMAYQSDDFNEANQYFDEITGEAKLNEKLSYYQADMNFKLGNFEKAIALAKEQMPKADRKELSELNKIIGECYFNLGEYQAAIPYLKEYKGLNGKWNNTDFYQLGYAYYKQGDFENAIGQFNKIVDGKNAVAQNAYYHLAECYLKTGKKQQSLNAFRNAANMPYSEEIKKDAFLNYARLSYEIGNPYENVSQVLLNYLEAYPGSEQGKEVQELLVDSYITAKDYEAALELLESNKNSGANNTYQKVAFYRGLELFEAGDYPQSEIYLQKSLGKQENADFTARTLFWLGEVSYRRNAFGDAVGYFSRFENHPAARSQPEFDMLTYNMAYAYFKQKDYKNASVYFKRFTESSSQVDQKFIRDAWLRMGDSQFVNSEYWPAMESYNRVIEIGGADADYAAYQKALCYGFVNRVDNKVKALETFTTTYPSSTLKDDVYYEMGNTFVNNNQPEKGIQAYQSLVREYRMSSYVPKAILKEGLVYYNQGQNEKALERFRTVVRDHQNSEEAIQAVATAKLIYVDEGRVNEYASWVRQLDFVEVTDAELDNASFEAAERAYSEKNTQQAIKSLNAYLEQFPKGIYANKANFFLAQTYFESGEKAKAIPYYESVAAAGRSEYTEQALSRLGELYLENSNFTKAIAVLKRLEAEADYPQNITYAQSNLMKLYYKQENYQQTLVYAEKVLSQSKIDNRIKSDAQVMIARASIANGDENRARTAYAEVQKIATGSLAAEALYYDAYFKHKDGAYEASNQVAQKLAKDYAMYKETGGKGLVIMAKNFYALEDAFQATYILESVIENFQQFPDITEDAKAALEVIRSKEAQRNSSVNPNQN